MLCNYASDLQRYKVKRQKTKTSSFKLQASVLSPNDSEEKSLHLIKLGHFFEYL